MQGDRLDDFYNEVGGRLTIASLWSQLSAIYYEYRNPSDTVPLTATPDSSVLDRLVRQSSPFKSILAQVQGIVSDRVWPQEIRTTAVPVETPTIWSKQHIGVPTLLSVSGHLLLVALLVFDFTFSREPELRVYETVIPLYVPADLIVLSQDEQTSGGGGGGGRETLTGPSLGEPPRGADEQFVPPAAEPPLNRDPFLVAEPTIVAPQLAALLPETLSVLGDPMAGIPAPPSSGPGSGGGIGTGRGRGVGEGEGPGLGPGQGGGFGGGIFEVGGGVTPPAILFRRDPMYSEDARKAQYEGTVVLEAIVRKDGSVEIVRVVRGLGLGLDENAIEALKDWKFSPAMRQGAPVDVAVNIEVNFALR